MMAGQMLPRQCRPCTSTSISYLNAVNLAHSDFCSPSVCHKASCVIQISHMEFHYMPLCNYAQSSICKNPLYTYTTCRTPPFSAHFTSRSHSMLLKAREWRSVSCRCRACTGILHTLCDQARCLHQNRRKIKFQGSSFNGQSALTIIHNLSRYRSSLN